MSIAPNRHRWAAVLVLIAVACGGPPPPGHRPPPPQGEPPAGIGGQHPPIPADSPEFERDAGGFVDSPSWYGEHSWADVRMRVVGHVSAAGRDLARVAFERDDPSAAVAAYDALVSDLEAIPVPDEGVANQIHAAYLAAARRDAALARDLASNQPHRSIHTGLAGLRHRTLALAARSGDVAAEAKELQQALLPHLEHRADLDLDGFEGFDDRHRLRFRLVQAYLDALDPIGLDERWGYWEAAEVRRQAQLLGLTLASLGGDDWSARTADLIGTRPDLRDVPPVRRPSVLAAALHSPDQRPVFDAEELGWLPTGDSLIDVGGSPGPRAIGRLERLGLEDPDHRAWLDALAAKLVGSLGDPERLIVDLDAATSYIDAMGHGSRYYNIKQLRNAGVRQLARAGAWRDAYAVLAKSRPLHHQDWACPNRSGILSVLEGRLLAESDDATAPDVLRRSLVEARTFLAAISKAEAHSPTEGPRGRRPPGPRPRHPRR